MMQRSLFQSAGPIALRAGTPVAMRTLLAGLRAGSTARRAGRRHLRRTLAGLALPRGSTTLAVRALDAVQALATRYFLVTAALLAPRVIVPPAVAFSAD